MMLSVVLVQLANKTEDFAARSADVMSIDVRGGIGNGTTIV